jgi:exonuclease SbcC
MEAYRARVAEEQAAMGQPETEEHYKQAKEHLDKDTKNALALAEINGAITNLETQRDSLTKQINDLKEQEKKNLPLLKWKAMCERGRMILHRDNLPNMVAQKYLDAINVKLAQYTEVFDVPFTATIGKDLGIECLFSGNNVTSVGRLSGGQKVMLGVAFRFAVHEMFAANLGLLALDEPTLALDDDHVECVSDLLEKVKSYSKTAGLQLIVVTHEQRLTGVFDSVIRV